MIPDGRWKILRDFLHAANNVGDVEDMQESFEQAKPSAQQRIEWDKIKADVISKVTPQNQSPDQSREGCSMAEMKDEDKIDNIWVDGVVCPWCGDSWQPDEPHQVGEIKCWECGKKYRVETDYEVTYTTERVVES